MVPTSCCRLSGWVGGWVGGRTYPSTLRSMTKGTPPIFSRAALAELTLRARWASKGVWRTRREPLLMLLVEVGEWVGG